MAFSSIAALAVGFDFSSMVFSFASVIDANNRTNAANAELCLLFSYDSPSTIILSHYLAFALLKHKLAMP